MKIGTLLICALLAAQPLISQIPKFTINTNVVNVTVLDRNGKPVENLAKGDFLLYEDGKPQKLQAVDFQRLSNQVLPPPDQGKAPEPPKGYNPDADKAASLLPANTIAR